MNGILEEGIEQEQPTSVHGIMLVVEVVQEIPTLRKRRLSTISRTTISPSNYRYLLREYTRMAETYQKLLALKDKGIVDDSAVNEIMKQKVFLEDNYDKVVGKTGVVVVCNEQIFIANTLDEAVKQARSAVGERPYYSETIDFIDYPSPFP